MKGFEQTMALNLTQSKCIIWKGCRKREGIRKDEGEWKKTAVNNDEIWKFLNQILTRLVYFWK